MCIRTMGKEGKPQRIDGVILDCSDIFVSNAVYNPKPCVATERSRKTITKIIGHIKRLLNIDPFRHISNSSGELTLPVNARAVQRQLVEMQLIDTSPRELTGTCR